MALYSNVINSEVPDTLFILIGLCIVFGLRAILKIPLISDRKQEQMIILEMLVKDLPQSDRRAVFREVAWNFVKEMRLNDDAQESLKKAIQKSTPESNE